MNGIGVIVMSFIFTPITGVAASALHCGPEYMLPGSVSSPSSSTFMILGREDANHIIVEHRSGTPPHNYQTILKIKLHDEDMAFYEKVLSESKLLPSLITAYYGDQGEQLSQTVFCPGDIPKIFGPEQKPGDRFEKLFPIKASLLKDADHEGSFDFSHTSVPGHHFTIGRSDVELMVHRYLPAYLPQEQLRAAIKDRGMSLIPLFFHSPFRSDDAIDQASKRLSYSETDGSRSSPTGVCSGKTAKTIHSFILLFEDEKGGVIASHVADQAPQNFQTIVRLNLTAPQLKLFRLAKENASNPPLFQTRASDSAFCIEDLREMLKAQPTRLRGKLFKNSTLSEYHLGETVGDLDLESNQVEVIVNRRLVSLLNPVAVAKDVEGKQFPVDAEFIDVKKINPNIQVDMRYASSWNFVGRKIPGYNANRCLLSHVAAKSLSLAQVEVEPMGYSLLVTDCYRPQRAVSDFVSWTQAPTDQRMKEIYYVEEPKETLVDRGYIAGKSGHSRGSTVDLTLVKAGAPLKQEEAVDCRYQPRILETGQLDMGTTIDCFSAKASTMNPSITIEQRKNRDMLKAAMEKAGFLNYPKEWWHFTLENEPFKDKYFDFVIQ